MTGKDMLLGIQNLDADILEEAEFGAFQEKKTRASRKKITLLVLAATLLLATLTGAAVFTRWSHTMQYGPGIQPSQQVKEQAQQSGLSVMLEETKTGSNENEQISATDQGITVTAVQTVMDQYGGTVVFRIDGFDLPEGEAPWLWWEYQVDGSKPHWSLGAHFFNGIIWDEAGNPVYAKNGKPVPRVGENQALVSDYLDNNGSIEFSIDFHFDKDDGSYFGKEIVVTFTGFGIQGETLVDEDIMTVPGKWELRWTLSGSTEEPKVWKPNAKIGHWGVTLLEAKIGQFSMETVYQLDDTYPDYYSFLHANEWGISPAGVRLKDGTDRMAFGRAGSGKWDAEKHTYTHTETSLVDILDPEQIAGMYFAAGYFINEEGYREEKPYYYIPFE